MNEIHLLIGGERRRATDGASFERRNPLDHGVATRAPAATADAVARSRPPPRPPVGRHRPRRAPHC